MFEENHQEELIELQTVYENNFIESAYAEIEKSNEIEFQIRRHDFFYFDTIQAREDKYFNELIKDHLKHEKDFLDGLPFDVVSIDDEFICANNIDFILDDFVEPDYDEFYNIIDNYDYDFHLKYDYYDSEYDDYVEEYPYDKFDDKTYNECLFDKFDYYDEFNDIVDYDYYDDFEDRYLEDLSHENEFDDYNYDIIEEDYNSYLDDEFFQNQLNEYEFLNNLIKNHLDYENYFFKKAFCEIKKSKQINYQIHSYSKFNN